MKAVIALDISTRELRLVESVDKVLTRESNALLPEAGFFDGMPLPELAAAVKRTVQSAGFSARAAHVAIPDSGMAVRDFPLPPLPRRELNQAVMFEARRLVPMNPSDVYYAWHATRTSFGYGVYVVAARREMIDAIAAMITAAGLRLDRMDLKPLALARGAAVSEGLVLEWTATEATLVLMVGGRPRFYRTFAIDAPASEVEGQLDELALTLDALVKFMRTAEPDVAIGPSTPLVLAGRFAFVEDGMELARRRFEFAVRAPVPLLTCAPGLPWQAHVAELGLLLPQDWRSRLTPSQGGDIRVAA